MDPYPVTMIFDTETSGFPDKKVSIKDEKQPILLQLAFIVVDHEKNAAVHYSTPLFYGEAHPADNEATTIHKKSMDHCSRYGYILLEAIRFFQYQLHRCDRVVAHNLAFDMHIMQIATARVMGLEMAETLFDKVDQICTMKTLIDTIKKTPKRYGRYGWPKLSEAYKWATGTELKNAHDAMVDVRACATVLKAIEDKGIPLHVEE